MNSIWLGTIDNAVVGLNAMVVLSVDRIHGGSAIDVGGHGLERIQDHAQGVVLALHS